jgi:hypothetical protein
MPLNVSRIILTTDAHWAAASLRPLAKETGDHLCPRLVMRLTVQTLLSRRMSGQSELIVRMNLGGRTANATMNATSC